MHSVWVSLGRRWLTFKLMGEHAGAVLMSPSIAGEVLRNREGCRHVFESLAFRLEVGAQWTEIFFCGSLVST